MASRLQDVIIRDTRANQPAATAVSAGTLYYVTDEGVTERSNGTAWESFSDTGVVASIVVSAGAASGSRNSLVFSNSNGVSFGLNGSTITGSHNGLTSQSAQAISAPNGSFAFQTAIFSNSFNVSWSTTAGSGIVASVTVATSLTNINVSAGAASANLSALVFSNSNNVSFGLNGSTVTASVSGGGAGITLNYFQNFYGINDLRTLVAQNRLWIMPMQLPGVLSASYLRHPVAILSLQNRTFGAVSAATSWTAFQALTWHAQLYTRGTGASSASMFSLSNFSGMMTVETAFTNGASNEYTVSFRATVPFETGASNYVTNYACTSASYVINTAALTNLMAGTRWYDIVFNSTVPASNYWIGFGRSTTTGNNGATGLSTTNFDMNYLGSSVTSQSIARLGQATPVNLGYAMGLGAITTNAQTLSTTGFDTTLVEASAAGNAAIIPFNIL